MVCCRKEICKTNRAVINKITNEKIVPKWYAFFRVAPYQLFFHLLLIVMVADFDSDDVVNNGREKKTFIVFLPRYDGSKEGEEGNYGIHQLFFRYPL